jgi:hypothetical protein
MGRPRHVNPGSRTPPSRSGPRKAHWAVIGLEVACTIALDVSATHAPCCQGRAGGTSMKMSDLMPSPGHQADHGDGDNTFTLPVGL